MPFRVTVVKRAAFNDLIDEYVPKAAGRRTGPARGLKMVRFSRFEEAFHLPGSVPAHGQASSAISPSLNWEEMPPGSISPIR